MKLFTKSAFKQALFCPASLYYYHDREHYANQMNEDDFLQALADGGNQVGDLAKVYYGVTADCDIRTLDPDRSLQITADLFKRSEVTIAEAAFRWKDCFVRADIIEKKGNVINLVEVKAKSWDSSEDNFFGKKRYKDTIKTDFREYIYDVAFQKYVIEKAIGPGFKVNAFLMMADKSVVSDAPKGVNQYFRVIKKKDGRGTEIVREPGAESLRDYRRLLIPVPVDDVCQRIYDGTTDEQATMMGGLRFEEFVEEMARQYVKHERHFHPVSEQCFKCPYYSNEKTHGKLDGRKECWREVVHFSNEDFMRPWVGELWCGDGGQHLKKNLMKAGKRFLADISADDIRPQKPKETERKGLSPMDRRLLQIGLATGNEELLSPFKANIHDGVYLDVPGLLAEMKTGEKRWRYPYHMIDFETTAVALPFYEGRRPYEQVAFQFSHHIILEDGTIKHEGQYINDEKHFFPNFEFIKRLKDVLDKDKGTIFRYADHENNILRAIRAQLEQSDVSEKDDLIKFINEITHSTEDEEKAGIVHKGERDMVDLCRIVKRYYYHPDMKGSNSIKVVLPAILNSSKAIQRKYSQPIYGTVIQSENFKDSPKAWISFGPDGKVENPYKHLDTIAAFLDVTPDELERFDASWKPDESVANGGAALAAYTKLQFSDEVCTKALREALLRYCELDTMSMVFIWEYFHEMTGA